MKKLLLATFAALVFSGAAAQAATVTNELFVCEGKLVRAAGSYEIVERGSVNEDGTIERGVREDGSYPMECSIDADKPLRQILAVCRIGDICSVRAKGEGYNRNEHLIQKVFAVHGPKHYDEDNCGSHVTLMGTIVQQPATLAIASSTLLCEDGDSGERIITIRSINKEKWLGHKVIIEGTIKRSADHNNFVVNVKHIEDHAE